MLFLVIILIIIICLGIVIYFSRQIVYPKILTHKKVFDYEMERERIPFDLFEGLIEEDISINSYLGYTLKGKLYLQDNPNKFVLMCHGITSNYEGMKKYSIPLIKKGYSIMFYDHRNHGYSDRNYTTLGFFEKKDAKCCVDYLMKRFNEPLVGVLGESMGAATALQLVTIDNRLSFCIEDCGYSNAYNLMYHRALEDHNKILALFTKPTDIYLKFFYKFSLKDVSVVHTINKATCPILFIHGEEDSYVPFYMCKELYESYEGQKMMYTVKGASHAVAYPTDPETYSNEVNKFLDLYVKESKVN